MFHFHIVHDQHMSSYKLHPCNKDRIDMCCLLAVFHEHIHTDIPYPCNLCYIYIQVFYHCHHMTLYHYNLVSQDSLAHDKMLNLLSSPHHSDIFLVYILHDRYKIFQHQGIVSGHRGLPSVQLD